MAKKPAYVHPGFPPTTTPPRPTSNVFRVKLQGSLEGQTTFNTFYYADDALPQEQTHDDLIELGSLFVALGGVVPSYVLATTVGFTVVKVIVESMTTPSLAPAEILVDDEGTAVGGHQPSQMAATLAKVTNWKGKQGRGRISVPAVPQSAVSGSRIVIPTAYDDLAVVIKKTLTGGIKQYRPGLYCPKKLYAGDGLAIIETEDSWIDMIDCVLRLTLGTARMRKIGVGI